ncbi:hypothetical protein ENKNEFLB_02200 [Nocardioides aquaticus]|uniref:SHOCT domain-containing protein n=1 Tax=Nocardioides aquaticus TaxID=160826 RepID=A0ABX8EIT8_9ACTN|nr:hypothetical protein [Nocardioides aquaticus]QVT79810.1 hypothetical protein ENKNEFLB_02200 [Nocardioides aquaticus]
MSDVDRGPGGMMDPGQGYGRYDGGFDGSGMMDGGSMDGGGWMIVFGVLTLVLLLLALAAVVAHLVLHATGRLAPGAQRAPGATGSDARTVLDTRLARGEVSAEEYSSTRALLDA